MTPFAGFGNPASGLPAGGPAMQAAFLAISAIVLDSSANMYVASSVDVSQLLNFYPSIQRVSEIDRISSADGTVKTVAGQATSPSPYEGPALQAYLGIVSGFVLNNDGSVAFSSINTIGELTTQSTVQLLGPKCAASSGWPTRCGFVMAVTSGIGPNGGQPLRQFLFLRPLHNS